MVNKELNAKKYSISLQQSDDMALQRYYLKLLQHDINRHTSADDQHPAVVSSGLHAALHATTFNLSKHLCRVMKTCHEYVHVDLCELNLCEIGRANI